MNTEKSRKSACVVFSGGQDSTTCLHWAIKEFDNIEAVFFDYKQRHKNQELNSAQTICKKNKIPLTILPINTFSILGGNSLVNESQTIEAPEGELPNTFVPGRNLIFLTYATAFAYQKKIPNIVCGVCQADYSGYPDCRDETIKSLEQTLTLGMEYSVKIHTPLMNLTKAETVFLAKELNALDSLAESHTCYAGLRPPCQKCPACLLREKGFQEAGIPDPLIS